MTLEKIRVKNFLVFKGAHEVQLGPVSIFCSGENGAGKTTLFVDSLGYALFGPRAISYRGTVRDIIARGSSECQIEVIFTYRGQRYKVIRRHSSFGSQAELYRHEGGRFVAEARGAREVDEAVSRLLGMDSETFFSTAVIRQGEIESIIRKSPSEFRNMLLEIFNIDFTEIRERLKELYSEVERRLAKLEGQLNVYRVEAGREGEILSRQDKVAREVYRLEALVRELESRREQQERMVNNARSRVEELSRRLAEYEELVKKRVKLENELRDVKSRVEELNNNIASTKNIDEDINRLERARRCLRTLMSKYSKISELKIKLEMLRGKKKLFEERLKNLEKELVDEEEVKRKLSEMKRVEEEIDEVERLHRDMSERLTNIRSEIIGINERVKELESFISALGEETTRCPLCGAELRGARLEHIRSRHRSEYRELLTRKAVLEREAEAMRRRIDELGRRRKALYMRHSEKARFEERLRQIESRRGEYRKLRREYEEIVRDYERVRSELNKIIEGFMNEVSYCGYSDIKSPEELQGIIRRIDDEVSELWRRREEVRRSEGELRELMRRLVNLEEEIDKVSESLRLIGDLPKGYEAARRRLEREEQKLEELRRRLEEERGNLEARRAELRHLEEELRRVREARKKVEELEKNVKELENDKKIYLYLNKNVFAEGKLPLLLLKYYVERIEVYAQRYLDKFMGGRFRVKLSLGRSGVEISIHEGGKARRIDSLSMGEKTAVGFALRLGLMSALAEARGVGRPDFLIIDEGLSAFDEERREAFLSVLNELRREFSTLVVISHLPDIADSPIFDMLVRVVRRPDGWSRIEIARAPVA